MEDDGLEKIWQKYLLHYFENSMSSFFLMDREKGVPYLFARPVCATCAHWHPVHRDGYYKIPAPDEQDMIDIGLEGKVHKSIKLDEGTTDGYTTDEFYGWCKRYPPIHRESYSIISFRSLFSLISREIPKKIADYQFPILEHMNCCGEWKEGEWFAEFVSENMEKKRKDAEKKRKNMNT